MYNLRYHEKSNAYYIELESEKCLELKRKLKKVSAHLRHLQDTQSEEWRRVSHKRAVLQRQVRESVRYVRIRERDIPPNAHVRPLYIIEGEVVTISATGYKRLVRNIRVDQPEETANTLEQT